MKSIESEETASQFQYKQFFFFFGATTEEIAFCLKKNILNDLKMATKGRIALIEIIDGNT